MDAIRCEFTTGMQQPPAAESIEQEVHGFYDENVMRIHFVYGPFGPHGPHRDAVISDVSDQSFAGPGTSPFWQYAFDPQIPASHLKLVEHGPFFKSGGLQGLAESQLILDDETVLALDDFYSPSRGLPPDEPGSNGGHLLVLDDTASEAIRGKMIVGWRWRINSATANPATYSRPNMPFHFAYEFTDCNGNGVADSDELASGALTDGDGNGIPDQCEGVSFVRGDANVDNTTDLSDAVFVLNFLFLGGAAPACEDAADVDNSGLLEITDPVYFLNYLFLGGPPPETPFPACGLDPTADPLTCEAFPACQER